MARIAVFLILIGLFGACCSDKKDAAESISLTRYDRDLTEFIQTNDTNAEKNFLDRYSIFHPLYVSEIYIKQSLFIKMYSRSLYYTCFYG